MHICTLPSRPSPYILNLFNQIARLSLGNFGLVVAQDHVESEIEISDYDSAAVLRVLWNSKERHPFESVHREVTPRPDPGPPSCVMGKRDWEA